MCTKIKAVACLLALTMALSAGCAKAPEQEPAELTILAAASLSDCMAELKTIYEEKHSDVELVCNFGGSGALQQQIEQGAPADVFFSAGSKQMNALKDKDLMLDESIQNILGNKVVLITHGSGEVLASFDALVDAPVERIAVAEPETVPVGQYTKEVFDALGISDALASRLIYAKDVREVLAWVETGNVDYGVVYETDAKISDKVKLCCTAPEGSHKSVTYPAGVVKSSKHAAVAKDFLAFLQTPEAGAVFEEYGFTVL